MTQPATIRFINATVIDGSRSPRYAADVIITGERITQIVRTDGQATSSPQTDDPLTQQQSHEQSIDARGLVLAPGFIDAHTHDDLALLRNPGMLMKVSQGVTTVVTGNCGISLAPLTGLGEQRELVPPFDLIGTEQDFAYDRLATYGEQLDVHPAAVNSTMLTGHSTLRREAMTTLDRPADKAEVKQMRRRLEGALSDGSVGMSTGLAYPTAINAPTQEIIELAAVLADFNRLYTTHMRDEENHLLDAVEETLQIGRQANVPVVISHHKSCGRDNWGKTHQSLAMIDKARQSQTIDLDVYPYTASSTVLLPACVARAERVTITWSKAKPDCAGRDLADLMTEWSCTTQEAIDRLQPAGAIYHQMSDDDLHRVLRYPPSMVGSDGLPSDERPHPRLWGTFPRVLGHFCRDLGLFSLEDAVHKMTGKTAGVFGLKERGEIVVGNYADLVLFDADRVIDRANYDDPTAVAQGIHSVFVNGVLVYDEQGITGNKPGEFLRAG